MDTSIFDSAPLLIKPILDLKSSQDKVDVKDPQAMYLFPIERKFESREFVHMLVTWMQNHWKYSFVFSAIYIAMIFACRSYMSRRATRFELRKPLIVWNLTLAIFSILGTIRMWPEFLDAIFNKGVVYSVCDMRFAYGPTGFWTFAFIMSKLPELVDTIFIVLRKQELIFLHWYHHTTVLIYCWFSYNEFSASGRWFVTMNYFVHSIMYSYYALKAMRIRVPVVVSKVITILQILQMVLGVYVNWVAYSTKRYSPQINCRVTDDNIFYSFLMYLSYFALFFKFFVDAYLRRNAKFAKKTINTGEANFQNDTFNNYSSNVKKID